MVLLVIWSLWKERNNKTFNQRVRIVDDELTCVYDEIVTWFQAGFRCLESAVCKLDRLSGRAIEIM